MEIILQLLVHMYYYDANVNRCYPFIYGGCGGNYNRFATEGSCLGRCRYILSKRELPILTPYARPVARPAVRPVTRPQIAYYPRRTSQVRPISTSRNGHRDFGIWNSLFRLG